MWRQTWRMCTLTLPYICCSHTKYKSYLAPPIESQTKRLTWERVIQGHRRCKHDRMWWGLFFSIASRLHLHPHVSQIKTKCQGLLIGGFFLCQKGGWALSAGFIKLMHLSFSLSACSVNTPHSISVSTHLISLIKTLKEKRLGLCFKGELVTGLVCSSQNRRGNTDTKSNLNTEE